MAKSHFDIISDMEEPLLRMRDLAEAVFLMGESLSRGEAGVSGRCVVDQGERRTARADAEGGMAAEGRSQWLP
jgi:hypothetical protein